MLVPNCIVLAPEEDIESVFSPRCRVRAGAFGHDAAKGLPISERRIERHDPISIAPAQVAFDLAVGNRPIHDLCLIVYVEKAQRMSRLVDSNRLNVELHPGWTERPHVKVVEPN